ncbi:hypothetical protein [Paraburkholderia sp. SOS3]|uniref:hypothetical protein n=1 Tax=Paraburkholderia sp. SOS3 TaxID=1926494 RepID=UPI0009475E50|nr:hypothetical protein [Paraburkholderia sp. SOS3]APR39090.1 hypothetical protein BTO02_27455 [Paraburkholderia sp. SOS3]
MRDYTYQIVTNSREGSSADVLGPLMPARMFFFVVVEEPGRDGFLVRHTYATVDDPFLQELKLSPLANERQVFPERHGLWPKGTQESPATVAEHVLKFESVTSYASASTNFPGGAKRFSGKSVYVDIAAARRSGARLVTTEEIVLAIDQYQAGLNSEQRRKAEFIKRKILSMDREVLVQPRTNVPATGIFSKRGLSITLGIVRYARVVQVIGLGFTAYDLGVAVDDSIRLKSVRPVGKEVIRQASGWGGGVAGGWATAVAAARIGASTGSLVGIELGPGAVVTGLIGGIIFGAVGYFGGSWITDQISDK